MGLPRAAVLALLEDRQGRIRAAFVLRGRLDDPRFSIAGDLATRTGAALAAGLEGRLEALVRGAGSAGRKGAQVTRDALRGMLAR
jgi:hypothetical protein